MRVAIEVITKRGKKEAPMVLTIPDTVKWYEIECEIQDYLSKVHQLGLCGMCHSFKPYDDMTTREVTLTDGKGTTVQEHVWVCEECGKRFDVNQKTLSVLETDDFPE